METIVVMAVVLAIVGAMALRHIQMRVTEAGLTLAPYQQLVDALSDRDLSLYRSILAGAPDIAFLREIDGFWPGLDGLVLDGVPPFDPRLVAPSLGDIRWTAHDGGSWVDYLGQPRDDADPTESTFILRLIDLHAGYHPHPHPGIDYDPDMIVASQIWRMPGQADHPGERLPEAGWLWVLTADDPVLTQPQTIIGDDTPAPAPVRAPAITVPDG